MTSAVLKIDNLHVSILFQFSVFCCYIIGTSSITKYNENVLVLKFTVINDYVTPSVVIMSNILHEDKACKLHIQFVNSVFITGRIRIYDVPVYPSEEIMDKMKYRIDAVKEYFESNIANKEYSLEFRVPIDNAKMRNLSLKLHLSTIKSKLINCSFELKSAVVKQYFDNIKCVYDQTKDIIIQVSMIVTTKNKCFTADEIYEVC